MVINPPSCPLTRAIPMREKLREILQELHLQGMSDALDKALDQAEKNDHPGGRSPLSPGA